MFADMRRIIWSLFLVLLSFASHAAAQDRKAPKLLHDFGERSEITTIFNDEFETLLKGLKRAPEKWSSVFMAVSSGDLENDLRIREKAKKVFSELGFSDSQFHISHPQISYWPQITRTQIWLVSRDTQVPYAIRPVQDACIGGSELKIAGPSSVDGKAERISYSARGVADWPAVFTEYKWSATNGIIEEGQGRPKVTVKRDNPNKKQVSVELEVKYIDWICPPLPGVSLTTTFRPQD